MREMLERALGPEMQLEIALDDADALTLGDATQLEAAVLNMAINARDAMQGRGRLRIAAQRRTSLGDGSLPDGDYLALTVADGGPGMTPDVMQRAFEPFFTTKAADKGTGLGLAQVFGYALRAGGTARIASAPGAGTAITLWLKTIDEPVAELQAPCTPEASPSAAANAHILLVDDDDRLRETLAELLADGGYRVTRASNGAAALEAACRAMPDLALIDCAMAGMNGATLAAQLRALNAALPMIFVTGHADVAALRPTLGEGAVVFRKPFTLSELSTEIDRLLLDAP
jgi:CheY-like chemotaxis protein